MLKVHLEPAQATVTPGTGIMLTVVVTNDGDVERTCRVRVVGLEPQWVEHSDGELTVPVDSRLEVPVRVTLPFGFPRGETLVGFEVQADGDERPVVVDTRLAVSDLESLNIGLSPVTVRGGWRGKFRLNIENRGKDPLTIKLSGRGVGPDETKSELDFTFKPQVVTLRPGERVKTRGAVSGKRHVFGNPRRRALTVTAQGETAPRHVQGAFVQRPLMPRNILRIVGLVLVLAMWAGGLTAGVRLTSGKGKAESTQEASASVDPGALGGPAGSDGSAAGGGSSAGSEEAVAPAAGGAIAGQVKGPEDASGITVKLRPVALADDLSTDLAAENVSFVASSAEDAPKESAQTLRREPTGPVGPTASTTTDADGRWAFGGLKTPANYEVTFSKAGFAERTYVVSVDDQAPTVALDVPMVPGNGSLSGTVKGPDGPLGGAVVTVTDGTVTFRATTPDSGDDAGKWSIDGLTTPATYMVSASLRGFGTESTSLSLDSGGSKDGVDLTMVAGVGSISGHITGAGVKLGNITVTATNGDVTRTASTLTEGDAGAYSLPQLPIPGDYTISVTGAGWIPQTMALALKGNASKVDLDLVKTTATIVGTIKDATGKPLASTGVTLAADKPIVKTLSAIDPAGTYELSGLTPGTYTLTFDRADYKSESTIVTVASGDRTTVDMALTALTGDKVPKDAVVRGIVRSSTTGAPITGVSISTGAVSTDLTASATATASTSATVTTDATGGFALDKLAPGSYDLKFTSTKYQPLTRTIRIGAKSDTTIDVTMLILGGVQGVVTDLTATPISGVAVTVTNDPTATGQTAFTASTTTDSSGQYSLLEQLPTGKYVATFSRAGYQTRSRNFEALAGTVAVGDSQLIELGRIHGTIQTADSGISGGFSPLNDVHLLVERQNGSTWTTVQDLPDVDGEYMITDLAPGDYRVTADKGGFGSSSKLITDLQLREERDGGLVLTPGAQTVTGRATFQDGATLSAVVGATVSVTAVVGFDTLTVFPFVRPRTSTLSTVTDSHGDWTLTGQLAGTSSSYSIAKTGFTTQTIPLSPPITAGAADTTLVPNPRNLTGTLSLIGSADVPGDMPGVNINITGGSTNATVHPDASGNFAFSDIPVRSSYTMTISRTGYFNTSTVIAVPAGDHAVAVALSAVTLTKYASFTPHVKDSAGNNLQNVDVTVGSGTALQTGSGGTLLYAQQQPGSYTLTFHLAGYFDVVRTFTLAAGVDAVEGNTPALAVTMLRLPAISVKVNGLLDSTTTPLTAAAVTARLVVGGTATGTTLTASATSNTYKLSGLGVGTYRVTVAATGYDTQVLPDIAVVADDDNVVNVGAPIVLLAWSPLKLHLQSRFGTTSDLDGVASNVHAVRTNLPGGAAVPDPSAEPTINFSGSGGGLYTSTASVQPGTYLITVNPTSHVAGTVSASVVAGTASSQVDLTIQQKPRITITTQTHLGTTTSLNTATVTITSPGGTATVTHAGGTNTYVADGLSAATYTVTVAAADHDTQSFSVPIADGDDFSSTVTLEKWSPLKLHLQSRFGTTSDLDGVASNVHAVRTNLPGGAVVPDPSAEPTINFSGSGSGLYASTASVQPGTYLITANPSTHVTGTVSASVVAGTASSQVDLTIQQKPRITITTQTHLGTTTNLNTATVTITGPGGTATVTHAGGTNTYVADGLTSGSYTITVAATDHDTQTITPVAISDGDNYSNNVVLEKWSPLKLHLQSRFGTTSDLDGVASNVHAVRTNLPGGAAVPDPSAEPTINFSGSGSGLYASTGNVQPGTYLITVDPTTHVTGTVSASVVAGTASSQVDLTIQQKPRITITTQTHLDTSTTNLNTATVTITGPGGTATVTHAGGTNTYVADGLSSGSYTITVAATDHDTQTITPVAIADGDNYSNNVVLQKWAPISIRVQGVLGGTTTDLTSISANVNAARTTPNDGLALAFSGGTNGVYTSTTAAPPGTYTITANPTNYVSDTVTGVVATAGTTTSQQSLVLKHLPQISITTRTKLGSTTSPLTAATVVITGPGGTATLNRSSNVHTATNLAVGSYDITVTADDGLHDPLTFLGVSLTGGQSYTDTADLLEWTTFSVRLRGQFNSTLTDLTSNAGDLSAVRVLDAQGNGGLTGQPTIAFTGGTNGVYTSTTKVRPGTYTVTATPSGYDQNTVDVATTAGTTPAQALLIVQKSPALTVTVNDILDSTSNALMGALVSVCKLNTGGTSCPGTTATDTTDSNGDATFGNLSSGRYRIIVTEANHVSQTFTGNSGATQGVQVSSGSAAVLTVDLLQNPPLSLSLVGRNGSSSPFLATFNLPGATATMTATSGGATKTLTDQGGGTYSTAHLVPGTYTLTATAPGYAALTPQTGIVIAGGVTHAPLSGTLTATPGSITGTVRESIGNTALAGVTVTASLSGTTNRVTTTAADGTYTLTGLEPGSWRVDFTKTTYAPLFLASVSVTAATASTGVDKVLVQLGEHITGVIKGYDAAPGTIATNNAATNLQGALISITRSGYVATATADVNGAYDFADIPANTYTLTITQPGYQTLTTGLTTSVAASSNRTGDFLVALTGTVTVTVRDSVTHTPLDGVSVRLSGDHVVPPGTSSVVSGAVTPSSGVATFANLPPGTYDAVTLSVPSGYTLSAATHAVTLVRSSTTATPTATLDPLDVVPQGTLAVRVLGYDGAGLDNATVVVTHPGGTATGNSGVASSGNVSVPNLDAGSATFVVSATGYDSSSAIPVTIAAGSTPTTASDVTLVASTVTLTVTVNGEGTALSNDTATLVGLYDGPGLVATMDTTGAGGKAVFTGVRPKSPSTYTLNALSPGYTTQTGVSVTVGLGPSGSTKTVNLLNAPITIGASILGLVGSETATVTVTPFGGGASIGSGNRNGNGAITPFSIDIAGLGRNPKVTLTPSSITGYTGTPPAAFDFVVTTGANAGDVHTFTYTPDPVTLRVNFTGTDGNTSLVTFTGSDGTHTDTIASNKADLTGLVPGVVYTITVAGHVVAVADRSYTPTVGSPNTPITVNLTS